MGLTPGSGKGIRSKLLPRTGEVPFLKRPHVYTAVHAVGFLPIWSRPAARTNDCVLTRPLRTQDTGKWQKVTVGETQSERGEDKVS